MKLYIKDMDFEQSKRLVMECESLHEELQERAWDTAYNWVDDYLNGCPADYQIGLSQGDYFSIDESPTYDNFSDWLTKVQHDYGFLNEEHEKTIREFIHCARELTNLEETGYYDDHSYNVLMDKVDDLKIESESIILDRLQDEYRACYDDGYLVDELDCTDHVLSNEFIMDDDYSHIYEHINGHYVKACDVEVA